MFTPFAKRILTALSLILGTGFVVVAIVVFTPDTAPATPTITWTPKSLHEIITPGQTKTIPVSFVASESGTNVIARVVPELQPYVQANPATFANIAKSATVNLDLIISAPPAALPGIFAGTVQLRGNANLARPLPITVEVWGVVADKGLILNHPPGWRPNPASMSLGGPIALDTFGGAYQQGGLVPPGGAEINITAIPLPTTPLGDIVSKELRGASIQSSTPAVVAGETGIRVVYTYSLAPALTYKNVALYIPHNVILYKFFLSYREGDPLEPKFLASFQGLLNTVQFEP